MHPVLLRLGPVTIHTYGFMMAVGVAFALWFIFVQSKKQGLEATKLVDLAFYTILISLLGAKLVLLVTSFSYYTQRPGELLSLARSGGVFQGGLAAGVIFAFWYVRRHKIPTWKMADLAGPALALGHAFGRIGCFSAGCCWGRACDTSLSVTFHNHEAHNLTGVTLNTAVHPVQLYEAGLNFLNFIILFLFLKKKRFDGQVFSLYVINYSLIRYFTEFYRGDHDSKVYLIQQASPYLSVSYPQVFCVLGLILGLALFFILKKRKSA